MRRANSRAQFRLTPRRRVWSSAAMEEEAASFFSRRAASIGSDSFSMPRRSISTARSHAKESLASGEFIHSTCLSTEDAICASSASEPFHEASISCKCPMACVWLCTS